MEWIKYLKKLDFFLLFIVVVLFAIGLFAINVATNTENFLAGESSSFIFRQLLAFGLGIAGMIMITMLDYKTLGQYWIHVYVISIIVLLLVYVPGLGIVNKGTRGWIDLGVMEFQTSEIAKLGFIISFAKLLDIRKNKLDKLSDVLLLVGFILVPVLFVFIQPDLGQSIVFLFTAAGMLFIAGLNMKYYYSLIGVFIIGFPIFWNYFMQDFQKNRIITVFNPASDPLGEGYHALQSMITVGSGGLFGKGVAAENTMTKLNYLPAQWTDFIFSVISETAGFIGASLVVLLLFTFLFRLLKDAKTARDEFGTLIISGVCFMFMFQIFENVGMTMGIMPITGITLPFLSYGGSSLMTNLLAVGMVLNVNMRRHQINF
ncbi:rod shape-determining protein RodA [Alkalibacter mobilis]|uniref:rod shape-determining protein RodA n=1 Tax=Alkalibacter mobilis TaxID=2787712 RepID=UPI00189E6651|nr:rod shape-determining protein RodA [Alkalibacter mobilis]MBF7096510.1 rod shape-determining protein RodA [Alkalibacter mobilis]